VALSHAQKGAAPVTSHGQITGYFVPADQYEEFERFRAQFRNRRSARRESSRNRRDENGQAARASQRLA